MARNQENLFEFCLKPPALSFNNPTGLLSHIFCYAFGRDHIRFLDFLIALLDSISRWVDTYSSEETEKIKENFELDIIKARRRLKRIREIKVYPPGNRWTDRR